MLVGVQIGILRQPSSGKHCVFLRYQATETAGCANPVREGNNFDWCFLMLWSEVVLVIESKNLLLIGFTVRKEHPLVALVAQARTAGCQCSGSNGHLTWP
jgi:hypothetical protein